MQNMPLKYDTTQTCGVFPKSYIKIRNGLFITISHGKLPKQVSRQSSTTSPMFELSYSRKDIICGEVERVSVELKKGYTSLGFMGEVSGNSEYNSGDDIYLYSIWVEPKVFDGFCQAVSGKNNIGFRSFQKGNYNNCLFKNSIREESITNKLDDVFLNTQSINMLMLESQILELLSHNIERLIGKDCHENTCPNLSKSDVESLLIAREILLNKLSSPPSLLELAHMIHMNDCKLKRAFKTYFGQTVYEFIRTQRLEKAYSLIEKGGYNVSQAAIAVGYSNISHFSQIFKQQFGVSPLKLVQNSNQRYTKLILR